MEYLQYAIEQLQQALLKVNASAFAAAAEHERAAIVALVCERVPRDNLIAKSWRDGLRAILPLEEGGEPAPRPDEEPFSEGFWAGRMSDPTVDTQQERLAAFCAYQHGERWNRGDGDMRPLSRRPAARAAAPEEP